MKRADGGANIVMKHFGIQQGRPKTLMEAQVEQGRRQMETYAQDQMRHAKLQAIKQTLQALDRQIDEVIAEAWKP